MQSWHHIAWKAIRGIILISLQLLEPVHLPFKLIVDAYHTHTLQTQLPFGTSCIDRMDLHGMQLSSCLYSS